MCCSVRMVGEWGEKKGGGKQREREKKKCSKQCLSCKGHFQWIYFHSYTTAAVTTLFCNFYTFILLSYSTFPPFFRIHSFKHLTHWYIPLTYDDDGMTFFFFLQYWWCLRERVFFHVSMAVELWYHMRCDLHVK